MVNYSPSAHKLKDLRYRGWAVYENLYPVNTGDTVTCPEYITSSDLEIVQMCNNENGGNVACSKSGNVITVTGSATNLSCTLFVFGRLVI